MKVSVYITSFNQKRYLIEAIDSVLAQTFQPYQLIIVDDCSQDGSQEVISSYANCYPDLITPIYHSFNQGVSKSRIDALCKVTGDFVTFLDGDDRYLPKKIEEEVRLLQANPNIQIAYSNYYYIADNGTRTGVWVDQEEMPQGDIFKRTFTGDFPKGYSFRYEMVNYKAWKSIGFYDQNLNLREDDEMRIRLTKHFHVVANHEPLSEYRSVETGLSKAKATQYLAVTEYIYRKNLPLLQDLNLPDHNDIKSKVYRSIAGLARWAALQELENLQGLHRKKFEVLKLVLTSLKYKCDYNAYVLILKILLPPALYTHLKSMVKHPQI
jgi:glycosyltransferase involved in cell wall biosynthesis